MFTATARVPDGTLPVKSTAAACVGWPLGRVSSTRTGAWPVKAAPALLRYQPARSMTTSVVTLENTQTAPFAPSPDVARLGTLEPATKLRVDDVGTVAPHG